jgi:hypothetical protein
MNNVSKDLRIMNSKMNQNDNVEFARYHYDQLARNLNHLLADNPNNNDLKNAIGQLRASKSLFEKVV